MKIKLEPKEIWDEYQRQVSHNNAIGLYDTVKKNENFFVGKQWEGVNAPPGLEKPVFNILKRVVSYFVSIIVSDDVGVSLSVGAGAQNEETNQFLRIVSEQVEDVIEQGKVKAKNRDAIRNAAVDGDACFYLRFDNDIDTGQAAKGAVVVEVIDNTDILFGNEQVHDIQEQPYIIVAMRKRLEDVREEARKNGVVDADTIVSDNDTSGAIDDSDDRVTVLVKFYKHNGVVRFIKTTQSTVIKADTELGYSLYPFAYFSWDKIKRSYHGQAAVTGLLPNQIFINKLFAMSMEHVRNMAFPKVIYNQQLITQWDNRVGATVAVRGDPNVAVATGFKAPDMSAQVMMLIEKVIQYTRDTMGASDAALGNIKPDNTSAIIAVQKSSAMPLELQRMDFYQFVEDYIRVILEIIRVDYGMRTVASAGDGDTTQATEMAVDFSQLQGIKYKLNVDIGASTYWSELMQVQTIDNLFSRGIITDAVTYLESVPDGYIKNKQSLIDKLKEQQLLQQQMAMAQAQQGALMMEGGGMDGMSTMPQ